jgi:hypothetical protein
MISNQRDDLVGFGTIADVVTQADYGIDVGVFYIR